jgi:hypothetical protein
MLSERAPFLHGPFIKKPSETTDKIQDHDTTLPIIYPIRNIRYLISPSRTLISEPPTFLTRGWGTRVLRQGVPAFYDENDDDVDVDVDDDDGAITTK